MSLLATLLWSLNLLVDTAGQLCFKAAASAGPDLAAGVRWRIMLRNKWLWFGVCSYVAEFLLWLAFLSLVPLSIGVLLGSMSILTIMIGGRVLFGEALTVRRVLAASLILAGVILVGWD